jgi:hypothetical protein
VPCKNGDKCKFYNNKTKEGRCTFRHEETRDECIARVTEAQKTKPTKPSDNRWTTVCENWPKCRYGKHCHFGHCNVDELADYRRRMLLLEQIKVANKFTSSAQAEAFNKAVEELAKTVREKFPGKVIIYARWAKKLTADDFITSTLTANWAFIDWVLDVDNNFGFCVIDHEMPNDFIEEVAGTHVLFSRWVDKTVKAETEEPTGAEVETKAPEDAEVRIATNVLGEVIYKKTESYLKVGAVGMVDAGLTSEKITAGKITGMFLEAMDFEDLKELASAGDTEFAARLLEACEAIQDNENAKAEGKAT